MNYWNLKIIKAIELMAILAACELVSIASAEDAAIEINGKISAVIEIDINPTPLWDFGYVDPGASPAPSRDDILTIKSNKAWTVTAKDILSSYTPVKPAGTQGKMVQYRPLTVGAWLTPTSALTDTVKIKNVGTTYDLASDPQIASGPKGESQAPITLSQQIRFTDDPTTSSNYYRIIVTFVGAQDII